MGGDKKIILLVEDQAPIALDEKNVLEGCGYKVIISAGGETALETVRQESAIDLVLMDINLGRGIDGTEAARRILGIREIPIVFISGFADSLTVKKTETVASYGYVVKGSGRAVLEAAIKTAFGLFDSKKAIKESDIKQKEMLTNISDVIGIFDRNGVLEYVSPNIEKWYGWRQDEIIGTSSLSRVHPDDSETIMEALQTVLGTENSELTRTYRQRCKDGSYKNVEVTAKNLLADPMVGGILLTYHDITYRMQLEEALRKSEEGYRFIVDTAPIGIFRQTKDGEYLFFNDVEMQAFECRTKEEFLQCYGDIAQRWEDAASLEAYKASLMKKKHVRNVERKVRLRNGKEKWFLVSANFDSSTSMISGVTVDITERKLYEEKINELLEQKETILKEVHHRIKNNISTIGSLLSLQASMVEEPEAVSVLNDAGVRLQGMMLLYDKLYQSPRFTSISVEEYLPDLIRQIVESFPGGIKLRVDTDIRDFELDSKKLQCLAIIMNELLTNIMKYAFIGKDDGTIKVSVSSKGPAVSLIIQDDGVGMPENMDFKKSPGFGLMLVDSLTKQLKGSIAIERGNGTRIILEFDRFA